MVLLSFGTGVLSTRTTIFYFTAVLFVVLNDLRIIALHGQLKLQQYPLLLEKSMLIIVKEAGLCATGNVNVGRPDRCPKPPPERAPSRAPSPPEPG